MTPIESTVDTILASLNGADPSRPLREQKAKQSVVVTIGTLSIVSAAEIERKEFQPIKWIVPETIPEGLTMLAGKPKSGKSWLAINLSLAVSTESGGRFFDKDIESGKVLYFAFEDGERRIKERIKLLLPPTDGFPKNLFFVDVQKFPPFHKGGLEQLLGWLDSNPNTRLVIIDTLGRIMPRQGRDQSSYQFEYEFLSSIHKEALNRNLGILLIHHLRKMIAEDPFDTISGTTGLTAALDTMMVLRKSPTDRAAAILSIRGRETAEQELALGFKNGLWYVLGDAEDYSGGETRFKIIQFLEGRPPAFPKAIADALDLPVNTVYQQLYRLKNDGKVQLNGQGKYFI